MATLRKRGETWYLQEKLEGRWVSRSLHTSDPAIAKASLAAALKRESLYLSRRKPHIRQAEVAVSLEDLAKSFINQAHQNLALNQIRLS